MITLIETGKQINRQIQDGEIMNAVSQVNNMADFMRLVSAARTRNSGLVSGTVRNAAQSPRPMSFQNVARSGGMAAYSNTRHVVRNEAAETNANQQAARALGTKFDAYA
jgi:hypothetical protein